MRRITLRLYLTCLSLYGFAVAGLVTLFGAASIVVELGHEGADVVLFVAADWFTDPIGKGLATTVLLLFTLIIAVMTLLLGFNLAFAGGAAAPSSSSLAGVDSVLLLLESFLPARTMTEVGGDVRERIAQLHNQGATSWQVHYRFTIGLLLILLHSAREALAFRWKKKG